jgi:hypothetical protein
MANRTSIFNVGLLDDLHNYFPDLLYNSGRFNTVQDVLSYVQSQTRSRFNLFDYGARQYSHEIPPAHTENVVIQPTTTVNPTSAGCTCPTCMPPEILTPQRPAPVLTTTVLPPPPIISRNRPRTHFSPTLFYTQESELLEPPSSTSELSAMNSLLSLFSMPMGQTIYNTMENVVIRPTNAQIASATTIVPSIDTSDSTCSVCQELIEPNIPVRRINQCEHQFHKACIDRWFERSVRCPMCRLDIRDNGIQLQGGTGSTE